MRESIKTSEYTGKIKIGEEYELDNIRCIYDDDYYSNKLMKGKFEIPAPSIEFQKFLHKDYLKNFVFKDNNGREIEGKIWGYSLVTEYNDRKIMLSFEANIFTQWIILENKRPVKVKLKYSIPYINVFSRGVRFSHGFDDDYIFKFVSPKFMLDLNFGTIIFDDWVYAVKLQEPDSKFTRELFIEIETEVSNYEDRNNLLNNCEDKIKDICMMISFIINHRFSLYGWNASFLDPEGKLTETINHKIGNIGIGDEFLEERVNDNFKKYLTEKNLSLIINKYFAITANSKLFNKIIFSFINIGEIETFEPMFLSAYSLLEGISKVIVNPVKRVSSETLIKKAAEMANVDTGFSLSHKRTLKSSSRLEWEISEYRNYLTHFNEVEFDNHTIFEEYQKIMKLARKLIIFYIEPSLMDWPFPKGFN